MIATRMVIRAAFVACRGDNDNGIGLSVGFVEDDNKLVFSISSWVDESRIVVDLASL